MMRITAVNKWLLPAALIIVCLVPLGGGGFRIVGYFAVGDWSPKFVPDISDQLPLSLHIIGAVGFLVLCGLQLWPGLRQRRPALHRKTGRLAVPLGLLGAASGLWLALMHSELSGPILFWGRVIFSSFWGGAIILGLLAVRRRDMVNHKRWMVRAYAVALPAGTLIFILLPIFLIFDEVEKSVIDEVIQSGAWVVHLAIAEWVLRRKPRRPAEQTLQIGETK